MIYSFLNDMLINIVQSLVIDFFDFHQDIILGCVFLILVSHFTPQI